MKRKIVSLPIEAMDLIKEVKEYLDQKTGANFRLPDAQVVMLVLKYYINERVKK